MRNFQFVIEVAPSTGHVRIVLYVEGQYENAILFEIDDPMEDILDMLEDAFELNRTDMITHALVGDVQELQAEGRELMKLPASLRWMGINHN